MGWWDSDQKNDDGDNEKREDGCCRMENAGLVFNGHKNLVFKNFKAYKRSNAGGQF